MPFQVLWRPDGKYFAIKYELTRGWMTGRIFGRNEKGDWVEIKLPADQYDSAIKKMAKVKEFYGKGCDAPRQWLKDGDLELLFTDRALTDGNGDSEKEFTIDLNVTDKLSHTLKTAKVVSIKLKPEEAAKNQ